MRVCKFILAFVFSVVGFSETQGVDSSLCASLEGMGLNKKYSLLRESPWMPNLVTNRYFNKGWTITWGKVVLHDKKYHSSSKNKLNDINDFWVEEANEGKAGINHLSCNIFCILRARGSGEQPVVYESPLFAKQISNTLYYNFTITKDGEPKGEMLIGDFVSGFTKSEALIKERKFVPIDAAHVRATDKTITNHSDLLALYTLKTNKDLFFKFIKKRGHRQDYEIVSFGARFFSSLDACEDCNAKIYWDICNVYNPYSLRHNLQRQICEEGYVPGYEDGLLPFHTFFYSYRPYTGERDRIKYTLCEEVSGGTHSQQCVVGRPEYFSNSPNKDYEYTLYNDQTKTVVTIPRKDCVIQSVNWDIQFYNKSCSPCIYSHVNLFEK